MRNWHELCNYKKQKKDNIMTGMDRKIEKKKWNLKRILSIIGILLLVTLIIWQLFFADHSRKYKVNRAHITIDKVKEDEFNDFISVSGYVKPAKTIYLDAVEGGRIEEILIEEGKYLEKGDEILKLSNTNLHLNIMNREAQLAEQMNTLRSTRLQMEKRSLSLKQDLLNVNYQLVKTKRDYNNSKRLFDKGYISKDEFLIDKENYELLKNKRDILTENQKQDSLFRAVQIKQLEESVSMLKNNLNFVRKKLDRLTVRAPIAGQLATLNAELGESINKGERLGQINITDSYKITADISEYYISRIRKNLFGTLKFDNQEYELKIDKIYPKVQSGNFKVDLIFTETIPIDLRIGQNFRIKLQLGKSKNAIIIPRGGFYQSTGGQWIFVVNEDETKAVKRKIKIGKQNPKYYEILSGLNPGEKVITKNYDEFGDAEKLIIK